MIRLRLAGAVPLLLLSACGTADGDEPAGFNPGEAQEIEDAAAMLNANAVDPRAIGIGNAADRR